MNTEQILQSLSKLDPSNKDHWTQNGQPLLSAVGDGVTRSQIIDAAPHFSRDNPVLPEKQELSDEEVQLTIEERINEIALAKEESHELLVKANAMLAEANRLKKEAEAKLENLRDEEKALDPRTDAEINRDLLKASFAERMRAAGAQREARKLLEQAGLVSEVRALTASPVDRAIAARIIAERQKKMK